jgi:hypothetical protein
MCYCDTPEAAILRDIQTSSVPEEALVEAHCWRTICRVRGRNFNRVDAATWSEICSERGYLLRRQNPRGF